MVTYFEASLETVSVHHIGNQSQNELYALAEQPLSFKDEIIPQLLMQYFLRPFEKANEVYHLMHSGGNLDLNEIHNYATQIFEDNSRFHEMSEQIARHLHKASNHPNIKPGELYIAHFKNVQIEGNLLEAVGIFKSENKETYLKVYPEQGGFGMDYEENAININKFHGQTAAGEVALAVSVRS